MPKEALETGVLQHVPMEASASVGDDGTGTAQREEHCRARPHSHDSWENFRELKEPLFCTKSGTSNQSMDSDLRARDLPKRRCRPRDCASAEIGRASCRERV